MIERHSRFISIFKDEQLVPIRCVHRGASVSASAVASVVLSNDHSGGFER